MKCYNLLWFLGVACGNRAGVLVMRNNVQASHADQVHIMTPIKNSQTGEDDINHNKRDCENNNANNKVVVFGGNIGMSFW